MACLGDVRGLNEKQFFLCLNTVQLSTYTQNKTIFFGTKLVGAEFAWAEMYRNPARYMTGPLFSTKSI